MIDTWVQCIVPTLRTLCRFKWIRTQRNFWSPRWWDRGGRKHEEKSGKLGGEDEWIDSRSPFLVLTTFYIGTTHVSSDYSQRHLVKVDLNVIERFLSITCATSAQLLIVSFMILGFFVQLWQHAKTQKINTYRLPCSWTAAHNLSSSATSQGPLFTVAATL